MEGQCLIQGQVHPVSYLGDSKLSSEEFVHDVRSSIPVGGV